MKKQILCGSSCVRYILNYYKKKDIINSNMIWITELAYKLWQCNLAVRVLCYNSNLYHDYKLVVEDNLGFDGFRYIKLLNDNNINIEESKLTKRELMIEVQSNDFVIMCVDSIIFNKDNSMTGGHFIVLKSINDNIVEIINPIKSKYEIKYMNISELINCTKNYGSWRVLIKEG